MPEIFPSYHFTIDELIRAYETEAYGLSQIISQPDNTLLKRHFDYASYLLNTKTDPLKKDFTQFTASQNNIIHAGDSHPYLKTALLSAHLSSCCELFNSYSYTREQLEISTFPLVIQAWLKQYAGNTPMINQLSAPLHSMDAVRTIQILRNLSLVNIKSDNIRQISLGAGPADKDIQAIHAIPKISLNKSEDSGILFEMQEKQAQNIIVSDNDPQRKELYARLSDENKWLFALNIDTYDALEEAIHLKESQNIGNRNFIVALRIDHRMLPDIALLFKRIAHCMDDSADLIISIGSGHTIDEYIGRINKIDEIFTFLNDNKQKPTLIKLHGNGTAEQQRSSNAFSSAQITSYQILHCKLKRKLLLKAK